MLRTSNYTIYVDLPQDDDVLLIHGYTAAHDRVSKSVASYLRSQETSSTANRLKPANPSDSSLSADCPAPSADALAVLKRRGYLTEKSPSEEHSLVERLAADIKRQHSRRTPGYVIMPTYGCNLRCPYCFQDQIRADPSRRAMLNVMDRAMVDRLFAAFPAIEKKHGIEADELKKRTFTFFGGEPFLEKSRPIIQYFIEKAKDLSEVVFSSVSNCTEIHHYRDLLGPDGIASIQVTFDGPPNEHDQRRIHADGSGSFEQIADNVDMALECGVRVSARINVDRNNVSLLPELAEAFVKRGWNKHENFSANAAAIHGDGNRSQLLNSWQVHQRLDGLFTQGKARFIGPPNGVWKNTLRSVWKNRSGPFNTLRASFCAAHTKMYVFDALGRIFACWERTGDDQEAIGRIDSDGNPSFRDDVEEMWRSRSVTSNETCKTCRFALICGGGCVSLAEKAHGSYLDNYCDGFQKRFRALAADAFTDHFAERSAKPDPTNVTVP